MHLHLYRLKLLLTPIHVISRDNMPGAEAPHSPLFTDYYTPNFYIRDFASCVFGKGQALIIFRPLTILSSHLTLSHIIDLSASISHSAPSALTFNSPGTSSGVISSVEKYQNPGGEACISQDVKSGL